MSIKTVTIKREYLSADEYEWRGTDEGWRTDVVYADHFTTPVSFFYTPDGIGRVWVETLSELFDETSNQTISLINIYPRSRK